MEYNKPDDTWEIFGYKDYESYINKCVVKGLFHTVVPKDILDSFKVAEYIMASAYYHYQMYDEAASKVMLIIEMAIKIRCENLGISLVDNNRFNRMGLPLEKQLHELIRNYNQVEPEKQLMGQLTSARNLRNMKMHPKSHGFSGLLTKGFIVNSVTLINKIFLDKGLLKKFNDQLKVTKARSRKLRKTLCVLEYGELRYLIHTFEITACIQIKKDWVYTLGADPVVLNKTDALKNHSYSPPLIFRIKNIKIEKGILAGYEFGTENKIEIQATENATNITTHKQFLKSIKNASKTDLDIYEDFYKNAIFKERNKFLHEWLCKV